MSDVDVLFFTISLGKGGAEMHLLRVLNHLDREGFTPSLAVVRGGGSYERELRDDVPVHYLPTGGIDSTTLRVVRALRPLRRLIQREQPDVVFSVMDLANVPLLLAVRGLNPRPKVAISVQNNPRAKYGGGDVPLIKRALFFLMARLYGSADRIVAISRGVEKELTAMVPGTQGRTEVIHNAGVDATVRRKAGEELGEEVPKLAPREKLVVACGRLTEQKGYPYLLDAFSRLHDVLPVQLWILGEGEERVALERQARELKIDDQVWMPGFVENPYRFMAAADVFALSSLWEGFGNVVAEAMACGASVVTTDCPHGPAEIVEGGASGQLVPACDAEALAGALRDVLEDDTLRARLSEAGRGRAQDFTAAHIAEQHGSLFRRVLGEASPVSTITG